jgi:hypothetical protein
MLAPVLGVEPMMRDILLAAALAVLATAPALAQQSPPEGEDRVVIQGMTVEEAVRSFVDEVAAAPRGQNLARWGREVCAGVINMKPDYAQKLVDHISLVALAVGMDIGEPGCKPNVIVFANADGDGMATRLVDDHYRKFKPPESFDNNLGRDALRRFETTDAPVRWWHVSQTVSTDNGAPVVKGQYVNVRGGRLYASVREDLSHVIIILDTTKIGTVSYGSLSDYVAMIALAQVDAEADTREFPSILNLFETEARASEHAPRMTQWDLDFLNSLYAVRGDAASTRRQENQITAEMLNRATRSGSATEE